jgi:DNA-binding transcriptional LysR family regulator
MEIGLRHLACFVAVAQERTLVRAAERLRVSQPAVSKTLSELERTAGRQLVERGRAGTQLTPAGEQFLQYAADATRAVESAAAALSRATSQRPPEVQLATLHTVSGGLLARAITRLQGRRPDARVSVRVGHNPELLSALKAGDVDLAVGRMAEPTMMRGVSFELLYAESLAVVTRPGHPLLAAAGAPTSARDLLGYPLVLPEKGTAPRMHADAIFTAAGLTLDSGYTETQSSSIARSLTLLADMIWITPQHAVQPDLDHGWLRQLSVPVPAAAEPVGILTRSAARPTELAVQLMQALRELALRQSPQTRAAGVGCRQQVAAGGEGHHPHERPAWAGGGDGFPEDERWGPAAGVPESCALVSRAHGKIAAVRREHQRRRARDGP